jgi:protein-disulfide isomerase
MSESKRSRRAALRAQQEAAERAAKRKKVIGVIAGVVAIAVIVVAITTWATHRSNSPAASGGASVSVGAQITPPHGDPATGAITPITGKAPSTAPVFAVYSDFQCPWCKITEDAFGPQLVQLAQQGRITLKFHSVTFLQDGYPGNNWSTRAAEAAAAADAVGAYTKYYAVVYKNQPDKEGAGFTDEQLRNDFPKQAGITGDKLTTFQKYYDTRATKDFVEKAAATNLAAIKRIDGPKYFTPTFTVNGKAWSAWESWYDQSTGQWTTRPTADQLLAAIASGS